MIFEKYHPSFSQSEINKGLPFEKECSSFSQSKTNQASSFEKDRSSPTDHTPPRVVDGIDQPSRVPPRHKRTQWTDETTRPTTRASQPKQDRETPKTHVSNYTEGSGNALQALLSKQDQTPTFSNYSGGYRNTLQALLCQEELTTKIKNLDHLKELADHHIVMPSPITRQVNKWNTRIISPIQTTKKFGPTLVQMNWAVSSKA